MGIQSIARVIRVAGWQSRLHFRAIFRVFLCIQLLRIAGCAGSQTIGRWEGPDAIVAAHVEEWTFNEEQANLIESAHYHIYTTIKDDEVIELLPQLMEGAMTMYQQIAPQTSISDRPMDCFIFNQRSQWDAYTQRYTGADAETYLKIRSGGYTIRDRYVAYYIGRIGTFSVASHEGWHQFAGRNFKGRLPPFLEEGIACMFETISWKDRFPRWNLSVNTNRAANLRKAVDSKQLFPLDKLCTTHAGDIVGESGDRVDTFYAQCWAFAKFLWEGEGGKYRPAFQQIIRDTANGSVYDSTHTHARPIGGWNRKAVRPMLEHYLGEDLAEIEKAYQVYMHKIAYEEFSAQMRS